MWRIWRRKRVTPSIDEELLRHETALYFRDVASKANALADALDAEEYDNEAAANRWEDLSDELETFVTADLVRMTRDAKAMGLL